MNLPSSLRLYIIVSLLPLLANPAVAAEPAPPPAKITLAAITPARVDSIVEVEATVSAITPPHAGSKAPLKIALKDTTGIMNLVLWAKVAEELQKSGLPKVGDAVAVKAKVGRYKESLQLQLMIAGDLQITVKAAAPAPVVPAAADVVTAEAPLTPLAAITTAFIGKAVTVEAKITQIRVPNNARAPHVVTLEQDSAILPLIFWADDYAKIKDHLQDGRTIHVTGVINDHQGTLQLKLQNPGALTTVTPPAP